MRQQILIDEISMISDAGTEFDVQFLKPAAARVKLITWTADPVDVMALTTRGYTGVYSERYPSADEKIKFLEDIKNTKLQTPLEMVHMLWLLEDVTRAFTHQLVRYRVGTSFIQESMRFFGEQGIYKVLVTGEASGEGYEDYKSGILSSINSYVNMLDKGVHSQDARGVLPTNILTKIFFDCSLRTLQGIMPQRLCCQAQPGEWQPVLREMRQQISQYMGSPIVDLLRAPYELGKDCGYRASFDRPCTWQKGTTDEDSGGNSNKAEEISG